MFLAIVGLGGPAQAPPAGDAPLAERLRRMEETNRQILRQLDEVNRKYEALSKQLAPAPAPASAVVEPPAEPAPSPRAAAGVGAEGVGRGRVSEVGAAKADPSRPEGKKVEVEARDGLEFRSADGAFKLVFHDLTQAEFRGFSPANQDPVHDSFFVPRQRWYFGGQVGRDVEFYTSINRGYGSLDLLDAFITLNFLETFRGDKESAGVGAQGTGGRTEADRGKGPNRKLRVRVGRMKTPYLYEYFEVAEGDLIAPERSLYAGNLATNRQVGAMALGEVLDDRVNYAVGVFNGPRRSFQDFNDSKDVFGYLNARPFLNSESLPGLKYLNLGGSINGGWENNVAQPNVFRTANDQTPGGAAGNLSPTFLQYNNNVAERGQREQYSAHAVLYRGSLGLLAEYGGGFQDYGVGTRGRPVHVPFDGYTLQAFYFLTGEKLTRRVNVVRPLHDLGYRDGRLYPGAVEVHARYSTLELGRQVFADGLADPNLWANRASAVDVGVNWYFNYYTKIYLDWQHAMFADPVLVRPGGYSARNDLFWLRFQLYF